MYLLFHSSFNIDNSKKVRFALFFLIAVCLFWPFIKLLRDSLIITGKSIVCQYAYTHDTRGSLKSVFEYPLVLSRFCLYT